MIRFFIFLTLSILPILGRDIPTHSIQGRASWGMGNLSPSEVGDRRQIGTNDAILLNNYNNTGNAIYPVPKSDITGSHRAGNYNLGVEYRYEDRFRILLDRRHINRSTVNMETAYFPNTPIPISKDNFRWQETSYKLGIAQYFPIGDFISIGGILRYHKVSQAYDNNFSYYYQFLNSSGLQNFTKSGTQTGTFHYAGLVPGAGIELHPFDSITLLATYETLNLSGTRETVSKSGNVYTPLSLIPYSSGSVSIQDSGAMKVNGYHRNFALIFKPISIFHIQLGYISEVYRRSFDNYSYVTTENINVIESVIQQAFYKSINSRFEYNYPYIQFSIHLGF